MIYIINIIYILFIYLIIIFFKSIFYINLAWYQRTYFNLNIGILFKYFNFRFFLLLIFFYFLNVYLLNLQPVQCFVWKQHSSFLNRNFINNKAILTYKNISPEITHNVFESIKLLQFKNLTYNICNFQDINGFKFPHNHPLSHHHLYVNEFNNLHTDLFVAIQLSSNDFNNCFFLTETNIFKNPKPQYIANNFYFYEKKELFVKFNNDLNSIKYVQKNNIEINNFIKDLIDSYKK